MGSEGSTASTDGGSAIHSCAATLPPACAGRGRRGSTTSAGRAGAVTGASERTRPARAPRPAPGAARSGRRSVAAGRSERNAGARESACVPPISADDPPATATRSRGPEALPERRRTRPAAARRLRTDSLRDLRCERSPPASPSEDHERARSAPRAAPAHRRPPSRRHAPRDVQKGGPADQAVLAPVARPTATRQLQPPDTISARRRSRSVTGTSVPPRVRDVPWQPPSPQRRRTRTSP